MLAAPRGGFLGGLELGFFGVIPVAVIALTWKLYALPLLKQDASLISGNGFRLLRLPVVLDITACALFFMGKFILFTYLYPFLETVAKANIGTLSLILLIICVTGFTGRVLIGIFIRNNLYLPPYGDPTVNGCNRLVLVHTGESVVVSMLLLGL